MKRTIFILFVIGFLLTSAFSLNDVSAVIGDITAAKTQSLGNNLEYGAMGKHPSLVQVDADTYALAYAGASEDGFISTFTISSDGSTITEVESLEHDTANGEFNSLVHVVGDTYALAYAGADEDGDDSEDGFISTFDIDSAGDITPLRVANHAALGEGSSVNLEHDTTRGQFNSLVQVDADTYALAYAPHISRHDGIISTFTISADGSTTLEEVESLKHDNTRGDFNSLVHVVGDTYALAYEGDDNDGFISTFDIDSAGDITPLRVANHAALGEGSSVNLEHDTEYNKFNSLVQVDADTYALAYSDTTYGNISTFTIDITSAAEDTKSHDCYDCEPPKLQQAQIQIASAQKIIATDDEPLHITANVGDEIEITLEITDDKSVHLLPTSGIYTNFMERPNDMNLFYANNFDDSHNPSTSFYEWNRNHDDVSYDYADTVTWSSPEISYVEFPVTDETSFEIINDELVIEHFIISFKMKFTDSMESSQVWVSAADYYGQSFKVPLPLILEILGDEPLDFTSNSDQKVLSYFNESVLLSVLSQWSESSNEMSELSSILGVNGELPSWTANLATWTVEEKITPAEMRIAIEYVINYSAYLDLLN